MSWLIWLELIPVSLTRSIFTPWLLFLRSIFTLLLLQKPGQAPASWATCLGNMLYMCISHLIVLDCQVMSRPLQMSYLLIRTGKWKGRVGFTDFMVSISEVPQIKLLHQFGEHDQTVFIISFQKKKLVPELFEQCERLQGPTLKQCWWQIRIYKVTWQHLRWT